jgi:hypothetical protein
MNKLINKYNIFIFILILLTIVLPNIIIDNIDSIVLRIFSIFLIIYYTKYSVYYGLAMCLFVIFLNYIKSRFMLELLTANENIEIEEKIKDSITKYDSKLKTLIDDIKMKEGPTGPTGDTGATGPIGPIGPIGIVGSKGDRGPRGHRGLKGDIGPKGDIGNTGPSGNVYQNPVNVDTNLSGNVYQKIQEVGTKKETFSLYGSIFN